MLDRIAKYMTFTRLHPKIKLIVVWLVIQISAALGIVVNWENTPGEVLLLILYTALNLLIVAVIAYVNPDKLSKYLQNRVISTRHLILLCVVLLLIWSWPLRPEDATDALRWLLTMLLVGAVMLMKHQNLSSVSRRFGFLALLIITLWFNLATLEIYPAVYTDEGWNLNKAWTARDVGPLYAPSINLGVFGNPERLTGQIVWWGVGQWLGVTDINLWSGRLAMFLFAPLLIALTSRAARTLFDSHQAGMLAALFTTASVLLLYVSHFVRQEIILATVLALGLYLHARAEKTPRFREPFMLGLMIALALDIHPVAFTYCFAFGVFYLGRTIWASVRSRRIQWDIRLSGLIIGGLLGAGIYIAIHVLPDAAAFFKEGINRYSETYGEAVPTVQVIFKRVLGVVNHIRNWYALSLVESTLIVGAVVIALFWGRKQERSLVAILGLIFVGWVILGSRGAPTYPAFYLPLAAILIGGVFARLLALPKRIFAVGLLITAAIFGNTMRRTLQAYQSGANQDFDRCVTALSEQLPETGMILGEQLFWLARPELTDYASRTLVESPWPGRNTSGWWEWIDPDIVLWPGPIYGTHYQYVVSHDYAQVELADCPAPLVTIWLKPGVELNPVIAAP